MTINTPTSSHIIATFVAEKRKEAGLTSKELAERAGLSPAYISRVESGDYKTLSLPSAKALADGLGLTLRSLLQGVGLLNNEERPSYKLITQSLRHMGYSDVEAEDVIRYARYLKKERN
jgi:transcriptional regulator with XRE-family HTH domain